MDKFFSRLGGGGLGRAFYFFLCTHLGFMIFTNLHGVFINTLLMRVTGDSDIAMKFNLISYLVMGPAMAFSVWVTKRTSPVFILRTGVVMYLMMYLTFFVFLEHLGQAMPLLAIFSGLGAGTYWYANNLGLGGYLTDLNRDKGLGLSSMGEGIVSLTIPFLSGSIISRFEGLTGYLVVFGLGLLVAVATVILSIKLAPLPSLGNKTHYKEAIKAVLNGKELFWLMMANLLKGIRSGILGFFLSLLLYEVIQSEFIVGLNTLLSGILAIVSAALYGRLIKGKNRFLSMVASTTALMAAALLLLKLTPATIILFSMLNSFCGYFSLNPTMSLYFAAIQLPQYTDLQGEFHGIRELFMTVGRAAGILFTMYCSGIISPVLVLLILTATQYPMIAMLLPLRRIMQKRQDSFSP